MPFYAFPSDVRRILYTADSFEAPNAKLRRAVRARGHCPTDGKAVKTSLRGSDVRPNAMKLLYLVLNRTEQAWTIPTRAWCIAKAQLAVLFGERFTKAMAG